MATVEQPPLPGAATSGRMPPRDQLLKWVGNKQRQAATIASHFPDDYERYIEPFVGTGAVLAAMKPKRALAADALKPLIQFWRLVQTAPESLADHYEQCWNELDTNGNKAYLQIRARYNEDPNPHDLFVLSRSCYAGVVRFTRGGKMSTPQGPHRPVSAESVRARLKAWNERVVDTEFVHGDFVDTLAEAGAGDIAYCDPPYSYAQAILYGSQDFCLDNLWSAIEEAKGRGALVALSIDGHRRGGKKQVVVAIPEELFARELLIQRGGCMLRRLQLAGSTIAGEEVADRLLFTW